MAKPKTLEQIPPHILGPVSPQEEERLIAEARADAAAGRIVPHEHVRQWLANLAKGVRQPRPQPWRR
jgi:hypothetical protein